jgi:hypothetical protein
MTQYKRTKIVKLDTPRTRVTPRNQTITRTHAVMVYVAGEWSELGAYTTVEIANHWAHKYQTNNAMYNQFAQTALHYRKYPVVEF